jgi:hypothetical protein
MSGGASPLPDLELYPLDLNSQVSEFSGEATNPAGNLSGREGWLAPALCHELRMIYFEIAEGTREVFPTIRPSARGTFSVVKSIKRSTTAFKSFVSR